MKKINLFLFCLVLNSCSTSKKNGESGSMLEPTDEQINQEAAKTYEKVKAESKLSNNAKWNEIVQRVSNRIAASSGENFKWEAILIESPEVNAWCMPGGKMAVYTGILPVLKTEAALAAVMGHEVAHATKRHGKKRYARAIKGNVAGVIIGATTAIGGQFFCKTETCRKLAGLSGAAAGFAITFFDRKFSREDESEADFVGQQYMAKSGYKPSEAIVLWERMSAAHGGKAPPEFMSTHPSDKRRRENLQNWLPEAEKLYESSGKKYDLGEKI